MKTLVIGASENPERYSFKAINSLKNHGHEVVALSNKPGSVSGVEFLTNQEEIEGLDTITLYVNPKIQKDFYSYILALKPRRVIFNPGTENPEFMEILKQNKIEVVEACTLVMLSTSQF